MQLDLPKWYDLHVHLRQGEALPSYIQAQIDMGCAGVLAMPNTKPPVSTVDGPSTDEAWSIEGYLELINENGGDQFSEIIIPLYLTQNTTAEMITQGAKSGKLKTCKYYPPHGTTGAGSAAPLNTYIDNGVLSAMEETGTVLCIHGEQHGLTGHDYFDRETNAEEAFYQNEMVVLAEKYPSLKIVCEHITTKTAVSFVSQTGENVAATITPQHLLYTVGDMLQGFQYHMYCLPLLKYQEDRQALRDAATSKRYKKFFAGTDSAPHTTKATECGCAAGCFTGGIAPQLYAESFEGAGVDLSGEEGQKLFKQFLCTNGAEFYGLPVPEETFTLVKQDTPVKPLETAEGSVIPLPLGMKRDSLSWSIQK